MWGSTCAPSRIKMIDETLVFLKDRLNTHFRSGQSPDNSQEDQVVFLDGQKMDPLTFKLGAVSVLLINLEKENLGAQSNRHFRRSPAGTPQKTSPDIRLNLYVLFVAHFKRYDISLRYLSQIIQYFQRYHVFDHDSAPDLNQNIDKLVMEMVTLPFSQQNEVWSVLRVSYHPSVLYRVKMIVFEDADQEELTEIGERVIGLSQ